MEEKTIEVKGRGRVHVVPDVTRLTISIDSVFDNYPEAYAVAKNNAEWMKKILAYNKLDTKMAKTIRIDISDHYESVYDSLGKYVGQKAEGYDLEQVMRVDMGIDNVLVNSIVKGVGKFIQGAQIKIGYTVKDPRPYELKMLERAVKDAREKAQVMAAALGCMLGSVKEIKYGIQDFEIYSEARSYHNNAEATASTADSLNITPEDLSVGDEVNVIWHLQ